jgi:hypothetical protein
MPRIDAIYESLQPSGNTQSGDTASGTVVPGSAQDPFYHSTGEYKWVTLADGSSVYALDVGSTKPPAALEIGMVSAASGLTITGTERNMAKEREAMNIGYTAEYIASRGGINSQGYFNDTPLYSQLSAEEYKSVTNPNGTINTQAQADILIKKEYDYLISTGLPVEVAVGRLMQSYGSLFNSGALPEEAQNATPLLTNLNFGGGGTSSGSSGGSTSGNNAVSSTGRSTNLDVLKSVLRGMGFNSSIVDSSSSFLLSLLKDGLDYDNAVEVFLNSKDYTLKDGKKVDSPFYAAYGYLNEGLVKPKSAAELYNAVEGYKEVASTYNLNPKFTSAEYLKGYVKNNVSVAAFSQNANLARLKALNADTAYTDSLKKLGYITDATDLTDFFLDPKIGEETLNERKAVAAIGAEAIRRASQGIEFSTDRFNKIAAGMLGVGLTPEGVQVKAAEGFQNIADILLPTAKLSAIYDRPNVESKVLNSTVQQELEAEEFQGLLSERRRRVKELETRAFQAEAGIYKRGALSTPPTAGAI